VQKTDILPPPINIVGLNLNQVGNRNQPWGVSGQLAGTIGVDNNAVNLAYKDPLVRGSDFWHFPTNQLPSVGWLGRVHRGTPWQTVYLKSTDLLSETNLVLGNIGTNTWKVWSGNSSVFDAANTAPVRDRLMFDIFTTEPNENASLGKLSVNQTNLAAWSALFSGLVVYTNASGPGTHAIFPPAGTKGINSPLGAIWNSIQQTRANLPSQSFQHKGDLLAAPALTEQSPFLPWNNAYQQTNGISDAMYEWLPQQTLSLVTVGTPRYVVYCYGQALKPAPGGLVAGGTYAGMCTNYQIVSESATRAVLQVQMGNTNAPSVTLKNLNPLPPDQ
jgi:hypothetical protein